MLLAHRSSAASTVAAADGNGKPVNSGVAASTAVAYSGAAVFGDRLCTAVGFVAVRTAVSQYEIYKPTTLTLSPISPHRLIAQTGRHARAGKWMPKSQ